MTLNKPTIFLSHITEEKEIAISLKEFLEKKFLKTVNVFASSHEESIRLGDDWLNTIKKSMKDCQLIIIICSPISISRPWINFEAGAGWVKDIPVIPFCHSGLTPGKLPVPINSFQGGLLNNQDDIKKLFNRIAELLNITAPDSDDKDFFNAVNSFEIKIRSGLLFQDTSFIFNLLYRQVELLKYSIYASTLDFEHLAKIDIRNSNIRDHKFTFNDIYNFLNISFLSIHSHKKVFEVYHGSVHQLVDNIKFVLTYNNINISPKIRELLNSLLFSIVRVDDWFDEASLIDKQRDNQLRDLALKLIKEEPLPPTKKFSNMINHYIDYYNSLLFYQNWVADYETEMINILKEK
ncbi:MAG: TIR domain-containing protein [Bacteroidales bacterium]|nr:TIR domain-containing protein [Bacteroidales bacterium]